MENHLLVTHQFEASGGEAGCSEEGGRGLRKRTKDGKAETDKRGSWSLHTGTWGNSNGSCAWLAKEKEDETKDLLPEKMALVTKHLGRIQ